MSDEQIIIEVAKLDGWTVERQSGFWTINTLGNYPSEYAAWKAVAERAKPYLTSRDAIIPVVVNIFNGRSHECINEFERLLMLEQGIVASSIPLMRGLYSTPRQLCIALLKATGKFTEKINQQREAQPPHPTP